MIEFGFYLLLALIILKAFVGLMHASLPLIQYCLMEIKKRTENRKCI